MNDTHSDGDILETRIAFFREAFQPQFQKMVASRADSESALAYGVLESLVTLCPSDCHWREFLRGAMDEVLTHAE